MRQWIQNKIQFFFFKRLHSTPIINKTGAIREIFNTNYVNNQYRKWLDSLKMSYFLYQVQEKLMLNVWILRQFEINVKYVYR